MAAASHSVIINAPVSAVYQVITDFQSYPDFVPNQSGARVLSQDDQRWRVEFELSVAKKLRYTLDLTGVLDKSLTWTLVQGEMMKENVGGWSLEALPDGRTQATYTLDVALVGFVPRSISNGLIARTLPDNMEAFKREVERRVGA
jgi:coenzyme Q-binding protein COQ10